MPRCQSWRPSERPHSPLHRPGTCHRCWRPCRERVAAGRRRCDACLSALLEIPSVPVHLGLAVEDDAEEEVLMSLARDSDVRVSEAAKWQIERRRSLGVLSGPAPSQDLDSEIWGAAFDA
jgi:hypothetical protein